MCCDFEIPFLIKYHIENSYPKSSIININCQLNADAQIPDCKDYEYGDFYFKNYDTLYLNKKNIGKFFIKNGHTVLYKKDKDSDLIEFSRTILNACMSYILFQRNNLVIHSSGVEFDDHTVLFVGSSGSGKSSMAYDLGKRANKKTISEDFMCVYENKNDKMIARPSYPVLKLDSDIAVNNDLNRISKSMIDPLKRTFYINKNFTNKSNKIIKKIFFLKWSNEYKIERIDYKDAFENLFLNTVRYFPPYEFPDKEEILLTKISKLFNQSDIHTFHRPKSSLSIQYDKIKKFL